jgi:hypothetical protein
MRLRRLSSSRLVAAPPAVRRPSWCAHLLAAPPAVHHPWWFVRLRGVLPAVNPLWWFAPLRVVPQFTILRATILRAMAARP